MITKKTTIQLLLLSLFIALSVGFTVYKQKNSEKLIDHVTIAILAKDKEHTLPLYLSSIEEQTWPKYKTYLYIRTNNNNDNTAKILREWVDKVKDKYAGVYFNDTDVEQHVQNFKQHEWNPIRFKVLGKIRQDSLDYAKDHNSHYFVADCDNFIKPHTLEKLVKTNLPIVAPLLKVAEPSMYSNYHAAIDGNGYYADTPSYHQILAQRLKGLIEVPVVHCTYFIKHDVLDKMLYDDETYRYEYVIFSDTARKQGVPQYIDNREVYGRISFAETKEDFEKEPWLMEFLPANEKIVSVFSTIYKKGLWSKNKEGRGTSGEGSTAENSKVYRAYLQQFLEDNNIQSVVDIGCGDWEFSRLMDWKDIQYSGYDIVKEVIENNQKLFSKPNIRFSQENFLVADLPKADLLICKDVFQHLSNQEILSFFPQLKKFKHALITNDINADLTSFNIDTEAGGYRTIDLTQAPFNLTNGEKALNFVSGYVQKQTLHLKQNRNLSKH